MTSEEMDAEIARMDAFLTKAIREHVAELTERLANEKNPYKRETLLRFLKEAIGDGKYG